MHKFCSIIVFALVFFSLASTANAAPSCNTHNGFSAADMSQPVTTISTRSGKNGLEAYRAIGVKTIIRYYAWPDDGITCKTLLPAESDAIIASGLNIVTVFQDEHDNPETFLNRGRGSIDAKRAMDLAAANGQPKGSAIYFAVDGVDQTIKDMAFEHAMSRGRSMSRSRRNKLLRADRSFGRHIRHYERFLRYYRRAFNKPAPSIRPQDMHPSITHYFHSIKEQFAQRPGYKIGAYGSGAVCELLFKENLIDYCWLAQSTGWPGYDRFYSSKRWSMVQQETTFCRSWRYRRVEVVRFDFNRVNPANKDYGQWSKKGEIKKLASLPTTCKIGW
jgi:hypothetical protein